MAIAAVGAVSVRSALDSPERQVSAFLDATAAGNESAALEAWHVFTGGIHPRPALLERRARLTDDLASGGVGRSYRVSSIEWWRTCCEPGPITDPRNAGLARIHVAAIDRTGAEHRLVFEVFVRNLAWWGDAGGDTERKLDPV